MTSDKERKTKFSTLHVFCEGITGSLRGTECLTGRVHQFSPLVRVDQTKACTKEPNALQMFPCA